MLETLGSEIARQILESKSIKEVRMVLRRFSSELESDSWGSPTKAALCRRIDRFRKTQGQHLGEVFEIMQEIQEVYNLPITKSISDTNHPKAKTENLI